MDRSELRSRLRELSGHHMVELLADAEANLFLNEAYATICALAPWSFLQGDVTVNLADGAETFAPPAAVQEVRSVYRDGAPRQRLRRRTLEQIVAQPAFRDDGGPWGWAPEEDGSVRIFPAASGATTLHVVGYPDEPAQLATDAAEPAFAERYHEVVAYEAARQLLVREGDDSGRSDRYQAHVAWTLASMARRYLPDGDAPIYPPGVQVQQEVQQ